MNKNIEILTAISLLISIYKEYKELTKWKALEKKNKKLEEEIREKRKETCKNCKVVYCCGVGFSFSFYTKPRILYVGVSKKKRDYWMCSVVENSQNVINFFRDKSLKNSEVKAHVILDTVYWLAEQKYQGRILIYSDFKNISHLKAKWTFSSFSHWDEPKKYRYYTELAYQVAEKNKIDLEIKWIEIKNNPAGYYRRCE